MLGFVGQLFWPYAFNDLIDFAFWPYAYDTFWPRDLRAFTGIYGGYAPQYYPPDYSDAETGDEVRDLLWSAQRFINFPIERIAQQVVPSEQQKALLDDLKTATAKAVSIFRTLAQASFRAPAGADCRNADQGRDDAAGGRNRTACT